MKKTNIISLLTIASLAVAIAIPAVARAENLVETGVTTGVGADIDSGNDSGSMNVRSAIKAKIEADAELRNKTLRDQMQKNEQKYEQLQKKNEARVEDRKDTRYMASTTKIERKEVMDDRKDVRDERKSDIEDIRDDRREGMKNASTSAERWGIRREAMFDAFRTRQTAFVAQLQLSIRNLEQISARINDRISKLEQEGKDMTSTKSLMVTAQIKIEAAKIAVGAVASYVPPTATSSASSVDLIRPRSIGSDATKAVREARDALKKVVESLIRIMGLNVNITASSTVSQ